MSTQSYKDLIVWQKSIELVKIVYILTKQLPKEEVYGLSSQMRRCAVSIPSNIAEGQKRNSVSEYIQFLYIANSSAAELETQLIIIKEVYSNLDTSQCDQLLEEVQKMTAVLIGKLKPKTSNL